MSPETVGLAAISFHIRNQLALASARLGEPVNVTLRLSDPVERDALRSFLEKRECRVEVLARDLLRVDLPHSLHDEQARLEVDLYLRVWESLHDSRIEVVSGFRR